MITLSDYMDYLNEEIVLARKKADEQAIEVAKEYAKHPYLKYFRVPRFTMPSVKLEIPISISELDAETKYNFKMDENAFISNVNEKIELVNQTKNLNIQPIDNTMIEADDFKNIVNDLEKVDYQYVKNLNSNLTKVDLDNQVAGLIEKRSFITSSDENSTTENNEIKTIISEAFKDQYTPVSAKLNNIFIDPSTSTSTQEEGKINLKLNVELVEEGIRIHNAVDSKGNEIEEIIFE